MFIAIFSFNVVAKPIVADLAIRSVDIDHNFTGLDILMFGARNKTGRIVVILRGPKKSYMVRKKERVAGVWVNSKSIEFHNVNSLYDVASTDSLFEIKNTALLSDLEIGLNNLVFETDSESDSTVIEEFKQALIFNKQENNQYTLGYESSLEYNPEIFFWDEALFRTILKFPKNIEDGAYTAEVYLFHDGILSAVQSTPIVVKKIGFEAFIYNLAHTHSFFYGIICIFMALIAGWLGSALFGRR